MFILSGKIKSKYANLYNSIQIIIELNERHEYSEAYKNLTKDFYLGF